MSAPTGRASGAVMALRYAIEHGRSLAPILVSVSVGIGLFASVALRTETDFTALEAVYLVAQLVLLLIAIIIRRWFATLLILVFVFMTIHH